MNSGVGGQRTPDKDGAGPWLDEHSFAIRDSGSPLSLELSSLRLLAALGRALGAGLYVSALTLVPPRYHSGRPPQLFAHGSRRPIR